MKHNYNSKRKLNDIFSDKKETNKKTPKYHFTIEIDWVKQVFRRKFNSLVNI